MFFYDINFFSFTSLETNESRLGSESIVSVWRSILTVCKGAHAETPREIKYFRKTDNKQYVSSIKLLPEN